MHCMTCQADIPPQWVNAIQRNECPGCGGQIMDDASKELLNELKEAMTKMPNDPEGLAGWLLSNYNLSKVGAAEPTNFHRKPSKTSNGAKPLTAKEKRLKIAKNPMQEMLKRKAADARKDFAGIAEQINSGDIEEDMYGDGEELDPDADDEEYEQSYVSEEDDDEEELDAYEEAEYNRQTFKSKAKKLAKHSLLMPGGGRPLSPDETAAMMHSVAGKSAGIDPGDNMPEALHAARLERLRKSREIAEGGIADFGSSPGTFRRSS